MEENFDSFCLANISILFPALMSLLPKDLNWEKSNIVRPISEPICKIHNKLPQFVWLQQIVNMLSLMNLVPSSC